MKIRDLKNILDHLTDDQLDSELIVLSTYSDSVVKSIKTSETNLYWNEDSELITEDEMKDQIDEGDDEEMPEVYVKKGQILLYC